MKRLLIQLTLDDAIEFWETCVKLGIAEDDIESKNAVLFEIISHQDKPHVWTTDRSKAEILADLKKNFGNVFEI